MTRFQRKIFNIILDFKEEYNIYPTIREIQDLAYLYSTATVHMHLKNLEKLGYLKITGKPRGIIILKTE